MKDSENLTCLLIAKLCHDLSSPLSVMGMIIESLEVNNKEHNEMLLDCFNDLKYRLQLMRTVLGSTKEYISFKELPLLNFAKQRKIILQLPSRDESPRLTLGLILIAIESMPRGGVLKIITENDTTIKAEGEMAQISSAIIDTLSSSTNPDNSRTILAYYLNQLAIKIGANIQIYQRQIGNFIIEVKCPQNL